MAGSIEHPFEIGKGGRSVSASSSAPVEAVWALLASPARWPEWAPHIRRVTAATGAAAPTSLHPGQRLAVHGPWPAVVPAEITLVEPRRWDFVADLPGPWAVRNAHLVEAEQAGSRVSVHMVVEGPAGGVLSRSALAAYVPLAHWAVQRLARLAERRER